MHSSSHNPIAVDRSIEKLTVAREAFDELIKNVRPKLHRYCARMLGSVFDAEDVVQEAIAKAYYQLPKTEVHNLEGWLFRIVHNKTIDYLREVKNSRLDYVDEFPPLEHHPSPLEDKQIATFAMSVYLQLTPLQRSCVILMDVIGYSLAEISELLEVSVGAVKAALRRGRENLKKYAQNTDDDVPLPLNGPEFRLLETYVDRFNARDFTAIRSMLADDVRLDLVERIQRQGADNVGRYFGRYEALDGWKLTLGFVDNQLAILVSDVAGSGGFNNIMLLKWNNGRLKEIRDYRYAPWILLDANIESVRWQAALRIDCHQCHLLHRSRW